MNNNICKTALLRGGEIAPLVIPKEFTLGTGLTNPSILKVDGKLMLNIRHVQYSLYHSEKGQKFQSPYGSLVYLNPEDDITLTTRNFFCELNPTSLKINNIKEVDTSKLDIKPLWEFVGLEDARLVDWNNKTILTGVRRDTTTDGQGRMELSEILDYKEVSRSRIEPPTKGSYCEKNWMPILDMPNHYVKWTNPTEIVKVDPIKKTSKTVKLVEQKITLPRDLRGGSQVVKYKDYWVALTHEVDLWFDERGAKDAQYYHRFIVWDKDWNIVNYSDEFKFMDAQIEFSCGLHIENGNLFIPFGFQDTTAFILKMPSDVFEEMVGLKKDCHLKIKTDIKQDRLINNYVNNPESSEYNFKLAIYYFDLGQFSSALSFFLRTAELEDSSEDKIYESLLFIATCLRRLGRRTNTELSLWHNAISYKPNRPEAYLFISQCYEVKGMFSESRAFAKMGLEFKFNYRDLSLKLGYEHYYQLMFQEAVCEWNLGQFDSARKKFRDLAYSEYPLNDLYKGLIQQNMTSLGSSADPFLPYNSSMHEHLRYKFKGSENITSNYSQTFQDMFVLSMLDGKTDGKYLEIGAADPFRGSNTAILENLGWEGKSLEILDSEVEKFKQHRKNEVIKCDATQVDYSNLSGVIDYLQVDCEPPATTYDILTKLPFDKVDFSVITYEHDHYTDIEGRYRELSREFLMSRGYVLVVGNIAPDEVSAYEDWYVHPKYIKKEILEIMLDKNDDTKKATDYMLSNKIK